MDDDDRRPSVGFLQVSTKPLSLGFSQQAGRFIHIKQ